MSDPVVTARGAFVFGRDRLEHISLDGRTLARVVGTNETFERISVAFVI